MAFRDDLYTGEIQQRVNNAEQLVDQRPVDAGDVAWLNRSLDLEENLGIVIESNGEIRDYTPDAPRIFVMTKDENGYDQMTDLTKAKIEPGSLEFWRQVQLGNVFAYPAGDKRPVQIRVDKAFGHNAKVLFSKPVTADAFPPAPAPRKPGFFARIGQIFSSRLKQRCDAYDNWLSDQRINFNKMNTNELIREQGGKLQSEVNEMKRISERKKEQRTREENKKALESIQKEESNGITKEAGIWKGVSMWKPVPEVLPGLMSTEKKGENNRFYTQEQFDKLEKYEDLKLQDIKIGGEGLTDEDFAAIAIAASLQTKYATKNPLMLRQAGGDWTKVLQQEVGLSKEEADFIEGTTFDGSLTKDLMSAGFDRGGNGVAIESMAVPGRRDAKNALEKYNPNDPESKKDLAKIIAFGVKRAARDTTVLTGKLQDRVHNYDRMFGNLTKLLERDPDLMKLAKEAGMDLRDYKTVKGMAELDRLDTKRISAKKTLYTAAVGNRPLEENVKRQMLKDILKANLAESTIVSESDKAEPAPIVLEGMMKVQAKELQQPDRRKFKSDDAFEKANAAYREEIENAKNANTLYTSSGKLLPGTGNSAYIYLKVAFNPTPKTATSLGTEEGQKQLDAMVDEIIKKDKLMNKDTAELGILLKGNQYNESSLIKKGKLAADAIKASENAPEKEEAVLSIKEEEKQQEISFG